MFIHCLFCQSDLSTNESIEYFPVGRRLAFDSSRGRLWVVCRRCDRWNLTPIHERWEAIEECERLFAATRTRYSTDQIGMARTRDGLDLIRIGNPLRPEFAAWRYGSQLRRRFARNGALMLGAGAALIAVQAPVPILGMMGLAGVPSLSLWYGYHFLRSQSRIARVPTGMESVHRSIEVRRRHLDRAYLYKEGKHDIFLELPSEQGVFTLPGDRAVRALQYILPSVNSLGGNGKLVGEAVEAIERAGDPRHFMLFASRRERFKENEPLTEIDAMHRLALEIAVNEETERQFLEREVAQLEARWKEAEEIAAISDDLFLPESVRGFIDKHHV